MKILKLKAWNEKQKASYGNHNEIQGKVFFPSPCQIKVSNIERDCTQTEI